MVEVRPFPPPTITCHNSMTMTTQPHPRTQASSGHVVGTPSLSLVKEQDSHFIFPSNQTPPRTHINGYNWRYPVQCTLYPPQSSTVWGRGIAAAAVGRFFLGDLRVFQKSWACRDCHFSRGGVRVRAPASTGALAAYLQASSGRGRLGEVGHLRGCEVTYSGEPYSKSIFVQPIKM
jgi:hypothetical protein